MTFEDDSSEQLAYYADLEAKNDAAEQAQFLITQTPREIDTALAEIYGRYHAAQHKVALIEKKIRDLREYAAKYEGTAYVTQRQVDDSRDQAARLEYDALPYAESDANDVFMETLPFTSEFERRGRWTRFFLVQNNGGHIHSSMNCSTCYPTTEFGWLPELSGKTEPDAVAEHGAILCTVCYPSAPTEWTMGRVDPDRCPGSGTYDYDKATARTGYYAGNGATCDHCGQRVTLNKGSWKMRKHTKGDN